jgi:cell wall-associated NlpC family hydrolase
VVTGGLISKTLLAFGAVTLTAVVLAAALSPGQITGVLSASGDRPNARARADIPAGTLLLYQLAAPTCPGLPWPVLAAVGKVESDHGRHPAPTRAGAGGPMGFLPSTWAEAGTDASGDKAADINDPADSVFTAAQHLCGNGARNGHDLPRALAAYNPAPAYADHVLALAATYGLAPGTDTRAAAGGTAATKVAAKVVGYARAQLGQPYRWGAEGPDAFDCSGLAMRAYAAAGVRIPRTTFGQWPFGTRVPAGQEQPGDLVFFTTGPGSSPTRPGHVGIVIGDGKMIEARCTRCGPIAIASYRTRPALAGFTRPTH